MQSADRALAILGAFSPERPQLRVSELAGELNLHKSTVSRLLAILQARGLVRRDGDRFAPGPELARLGVLAVNGLPLVQAAREPLASLAEDTEETVNLAVRRGEEAVNVLQVQTAHFVGMTDWTGRGAPLHATANGKILLAFGDGAPPVELPPLTRQTITDHAAFEAELARARSRGFATAVEELEVGLNAVAAPVFDAAGTCIAAVSVSGPAFRLPARKLTAVAPQCRASAQEISAALGHRVTDE
ncbi:MAG: IclR family transcriptional regulator [Gaiellaceae bacterium]